MISIAVIKRPDRQINYGSGKDVKWTTAPEATLKQAEFMYDVGTIKVKPKSWKDYFFPEAYGLPGS